MPEQVTKRKYVKTGKYSKKTQELAQQIQAASVGGAANTVGNKDLSISRLRLSEFGTEAMNKIRSIAEQSAPEDLKWPTRLLTYSRMKYDSSIAAAYDLSYLYIEKRFSKFKIHFNENNPESKDAAKFVEWNLTNLEGQTLRQIARSAATFKEQGFSVLEKVYQEVKEENSEYLGKYKLRKLAFRPQESLNRTEPFIYGEDGRKLIGLQQDPSYFSNSISGGLRYIKSDVQQIPRHKFILLGYNATESNPIGVSPLNSVYKPWKEKSLMEQLEVVGVSKDMGGMPVLSAPSEILNKASEDLDSPEAKSLEILQTGMANMHSGDQSYMILPSDPHESSQIAQYQIKFLGIEGSGKQFDTHKLINDRKKDILDRFGCGFLILGNDNVGSNSLAENKSSLHAQFVNRDAEIIEEGINTDLIPQLLALNGIRLSAADMPYIETGYVEDPNEDTASKAVQRVGAVGYLAQHPALLNEVMEKLDYNFRLPSFLLENGTFDYDAWDEYKQAFLPKSTSRSGDGMISGMNDGVGDNTGNKDSSTENSENS